MVPTTDATNTLDVDLVFTGTASASPSPSASSSAPASATVRGYRGYGGKYANDQRFGGNGSEVILYG